MNSKSIFIIFAFLLTTTNLFSQDLEHFNQERIKMTSEGMLVLGTWAAGNIIVNPILQRNAIGSRKYFYQMNTLWNIVNLGIAGASYYNAVKGDASSFTLANSLLEQNKIEKLLLFNAGLDLAYIATGFYLRERSQTTLKNPDRLLGFGQSFILQGAWLFAFDLGFYFIQNHHSHKLFSIIEGLSFTPNEFVISFKI